MTGTCSRPWGSITFACSKRPSFQRLRVLAVRRATHEGRHDVAAGRFPLTRATPRSSGGCARRRVPRCWHPPATAVPATPTTRPVRRAESLTKDGYNSSVTPDSVVSCCSARMPFQALGSPQQIPQNGLRLVIRMMGEKKARAAVFPRAFCEKTVSRVAGRRLHRRVGFLHQTRDIRRSNFTFQSKRSCQPPDEFRIFRGRPPSQAMVEMADHQVPESRVRQQMQQRH